MTRRRKHKCLLLLFLLLFVLFVTIAFYGAPPPKVKAIFPVGPRQGHNPFITTFPRKNKSKIDGGKQEKTVLLWTDFFGSKDWYTTERTFLSCAVKTCRVTKDKGEVTIADAVLMNVRNIYSPSDLPHIRSPHQVWIIHGSEPPYYVTIDLQSFNNVFNWTSWYRSDADIFSPYGHFTPVGPVKDSRIQREESNPTRQHHTITTPPPSPPPPPFFQPNFLDDNEKEQLLHLPPLYQEDKVDFFSLHDRLVFWAASSCICYSQRYKMVEALQKLIPVDTFGFCGQQSCLKGDPECHRLLKRYKFVLAFENGYCRDYVTEKYWNALSRNQIPVVSGGADYSRLAIPGSYIDVDSFGSVEQLARYILRVASDRHLYNSFFLWREAYTRLPHGIVNWCQLCALLHEENSRAPQVYSDFAGWVAEDSCPVHTLFQHLRWLLQYISYKALGV